MDSSRLIIDGMHSGPSNMAVDETLLESAIERGIATVRIYAWSEPTVSLGYFQRARDAHADPRLDGLAVVRRLSGGGAILHHHEITYSIALPATHPGAAEPSRLYRLAHEAIIRVLTESIDAAPPAGPRLTGDVSALRMRGDRKIDPRSSILDPRNAAPDPFLCFGRGDPNDIVLGPHKIVGSAQRRRRGAVLQHGSILLQRSPHAPEFPGIQDLSGVELPSPALAEACGRRIAKQLADDWRESGLSPAEHDRVAELIATRYTVAN